MTPPTKRRYQFHTGMFLSLLSLMVLFSTIPPAEAFHLWPSKKTDDPKIENYEPLPPEDYTTRCEPLRQHIQEIYDKPAWIRGLYIPRREILIARHRRCKTNINTREYNYLKHVDIPNPSLEKLPGSDAPAGDGEPEEGTP